MAWNLVPHIITWELTRACQLHCRARAIPRRDFRELSLTDTEATLDNIQQMHPRPMVIFTGGDPLERDDLPEIIKAAVSRQTRTSLAPSVTSLLTPRVIETWERMSVSSVSLSLDGTTQGIHDRFRGILGTFARSIDIARIIANSGMSL